jgi:hypothetical protein
MRKQISHTTLSISELVMKISGEPANNQACDVPDGTIFFGTIKVGEISASVATETQPRIKAATSQCPEDTALTPPSCDRNAYVCRRYNTHNEIVS